MCRRGGSTRSARAECAVIADTDLRLTRYFGLSDGFFLRLQMDHDLRLHKRALAKKLAGITPRAA